MKMISRMLFRSTLAALALSASSAHAAILYTFNMPAGAGSVVGSVTTDGSFGVLSAGNFTAWNLTVTGLGGVTDVLTNLNSGVFSGGSKITADAVNIYFDFTHDNANPSFLLFQKIFSSGANYACASNATFALTPCLEGTSAVPQSFNSPSAAYGSPSGLEIIASVAAVPEPASWALMIAGFGLVGGAMRRRVTKVSYA